MPRTALDGVADLHALLRAAGVPGSYVFAGHSLGGLFVRLYASTYPRDVLGLVLVDAYSEKLETLLTPERWAALVRLNTRFGTDTVMPIPGYGDLETLGYGKDNSVMRHAAATTPLGPMPLAVLAHARPFDVPEWNGGVLIRYIGSGLACGERGHGDARPKRALLRRQRQWP
jgi:pimeloyl-ACP methyl ester carboxylesterase